MKVSYINSLCVKNDAISNALRREIEILSRSRLGEPLLFTHDCHFEQIPHVRVRNAAEVLLHPHFQSSELVVFHFGIYYSLFDLLSVVPRGAQRLVGFHNVTPKDVLPEREHPTIDRSLAQISNMLWADHVICVSQTNLDFLRSRGVMTPATVLPLAVSSDVSNPESKPSFSDGIVRIAFVGRFVSSKGPGDLVDIMRGLCLRISSPRLRIDMIGNIDFSDPTLFASVSRQLEKLQVEFPGRISAQIHANAADAVKLQVLRHADVFVLPTYHEGFCVPIVEALSSGCRVIAYDNSNIPAICGGLGNLVPTGDRRTLEQQVEMVVRDVSDESWRSGGYLAYLQDCQRHVRQFNPERVERQFVRFLRNWTAN